jgi:hypothetical protein
MKRYSEEGFEHESERNVPKMKVGTGLLRCHVEEGIISE